MIVARAESKSSSPQRFNINGENAEKPVSKLFKGPLRAFVIARLRRVHLV